MSLATEGSTSRSVSSYLVEGCHSSGQESKYTERPRYVREPIHRHARALIYRLFDEKDPPSVPRETRR